MNRVFFTLACLLCGGFLNAQITLESTDVGAVGSQYLLGYDTLNTAGLDEGPAGTNQSWDFTGLAVHLIDTVDFEAPNNTPFGSSFPNANLTIVSSLENTWSYMEKTPTALNLHGLAIDFGTGSPVVVPLNPAVGVIPFPLNYGDNGSSTITIDEKLPFTQIAFVDSVRYKSISQQSLSVDAWGSLTIPGGTYNCLRTKNVDFTIDSTWAHNTILNSWSLVDDNSGTDTTFAWWDKTKGYVLAEVFYSDGNLDYIHTQDPVITSIDDAAFEDPNLALYPNPSGSVLNLVWENPKVRQARIMDLQGRTLLTQDLQGGSQQFDLSQLPEGIYLLRLLDAEGKRLSTRRFAVSR